MWVFDWHPDEFEAWNRFDLLNQRGNKTVVDRNLEKQMPSREIWMLFTGHNPFIPSAYKPDCCLLNDYKRMKTPGLNRETALNTVSGWGDSL